LKNIAMSTLNLLLRGPDGGATQLEFFARRLLMAGFTGRNQKLAMKHVEELRHLGVVAPKKIPSFYAVPNHLVSTATELEVLGNKTSGEVEPVLLFQRGKTYLGVGSDHTDRELEKASIAKSKVMCGKILASEVWEYRDIKGRWDNLVLRSWIGGSSKRTIYQQAELGTFLRPEKVIRLAQGYTRGGNLEGTVLFLGTIPIVGSGFGFAPIFSGELVDPARNRQLSFSYKIKPMNWLRGNF
jgi:hypothetical protein